MRGAAEAYTANGLAIVVHCAAEPGRISAGSSEVAARLGDLTIVNPFEGVPGTRFSLSAICGGSQQ